jgi:hypothetical protein
VRQILAANGLKSVLTPTGRPAPRPIGVATGPDTVRIGEPPAPYIEVGGEQLTDAELRLAAACVRSYAALRGKDAEGQKGTTVAPIAARDATEAAELAAKLERIRTRHASARPGADHVCDRDGPSVPVAMDAPTCSRCGVPQVFD